MTWLNRYTNFSTPTKSKPKDTSHNVDCDDNDDDDVLALPTPKTSKSSSPTTSPLDSSTTTLPTDYDPSSSLHLMNSIRKFDNSIELEDDPTESNVNNGVVGRSTKIILEDGAVVEHRSTKRMNKTFDENSGIMLGSPKRMLSNAKQRLHSRTNRFSTVCCYNKDNGQREICTKCSRNGLLTWALVATILLIINFAVSINIITNANHNQEPKLSAITDGTTTTSGCNTNADGGEVSNHVAESNNNSNTNTSIGGTTTVTTGSSPYDISKKDAYDPSLLCGCPSCVQEVWNKPIGSPAYTCGERIEYLLLEFPGQYPTQIDACRQIAFEFPCDCGSCDPSRCGIYKEEFFVPSGWIPQDDYTAQQTPAPQSDIIPGQLYCYPPEGQRVMYANVWNAGYYVEVKQGADAAALCGPGNNKFLPDNVVVDQTTGGVKLQYKNSAASEIRVLLPNNEKFTYGTYQFEIGNIEVRNAAGTVISTELPKELVLGLFTWDDTENYAIHENYNHEVDIEISRWNCGTNADVQFLVQPPGFPQMHRFFSGTEPGVYAQGNQFFEFTWNPGRIDWYGSAGGGQQFALKTEEALYMGLQDYVQCMPDKGFQTEVRMNLWNMLGSQVPATLAYDDIVEVTIKNFGFIPSTLEFVEDGYFCSKHCQCSSSSTCEGGICTAIA